jgi:hypothetical protein
MSDFLISDSRFRNSTERAVGPEFNLEIINIFTSAIKNFIAEYGAFAGTLSDAITERGKPLVNTRLQVDKNGLLTGISELNEESKNSILEGGRTYTWGRVIDADLWLSYFHTPQLLSLGEHEVNQTIRENVRDFMSQLATAQYLLELAKPLDGDKKREYIETISEFLNQAGYTMNNIRSAIGEKFNPPIGPLENRPYYSL